MITKTNGGNMKNIFIALVIGIFLVGFVSSLETTRTITPIELDKNSLSLFTSTLKMIEFKVSSVSATEIKCDKICQNEVQIQKDKDLVKSKVSIIPFSKEVKVKGWKITKLTEEQIKKQQETANYERIKLYLANIGRVGVKK